MVQEEGRAINAPKRKHCSEKQGQQFITAGDKSFKKMGTVKTKFIQDLLELGIAPILTDADVVWLKDPRSYFKRGTYITADVFVSTIASTYPWIEKTTTDAHVNFNTGVLHFRPTDAAKAVSRRGRRRLRRRRSRG